MSTAIRSIKVIFVHIYGQLTVVIFTALNCNAFPLRGIMMIQIRS